MSSSEAPGRAAPRSLPLDWINIIFLAAVHLAAFGGLALYLPLHGMTWTAATLWFVLTGVSIFCISAGYHRLFSHRTYEAHPALRAFLLAFGAGNFQNTALAWSQDHRRHHARTDSDLDPYSAKRGFWYSHIGWVLYKADTTIKPTPVLDLERDRLVLWQHRNYPLLATIFGVVIPVALGWAFGDPWGGFVMGVAVRLVCVYHATFSINSIAHMFGTQPYSDKNSARDSFITALVSMGEGYHNFHHTFPADYRNGFRAYQYDPTKWILQAFAVIGLAKNLRRTPDPVVMRARLRREARRVFAAGLKPTAQERLQRLQASIDHALDRWHELVAQYEAARRDATGRARDLMTELRAELRRTRRELQANYASWRRALRSPEIAL